MAKRKNKKKPSPPREDVTPERRQHGEIVSIGMARRVVPVIVSLHKAGHLNQAEYEALAYYRDQASLADKSPIKSGIDFSVKGGEHGPGVAIISAMRETWRMESDLGPLWSIARAVAVDDVTLSKWAIERHGGVDTNRDGIVPKAGKVELARLELKMAAHKITNAA